MRVCMGERNLAQLKPFPQSCVLHKVTPLKTAWNSVWERGIWLNIKPFLQSCVLHKVTPLKTAWNSQTRKAGD